MTVKQVCEEKGFRAAAIEIVNKRIAYLSGGGLSREDLPDTASLCDIIDQIEEVLAADKGKDMLEESSKKVIESLLEDIDLNFLGDMIFD
jgi:hypothetical protein